VDREIGALAGAINFCSRCALASGCFEADGIHEFVEIVNDALIEPIKLATLLVLKFAVAGDGGQ
jgi:hypothetical protein